MNLSMKRKQTHRQKEQTCDCHGGGELGDWWSGRLRLADVSIIYMEEINNKVLLYGTDKYIQCPKINQNGKEYLKKNIYRSSC